MTVRVDPTTLPDAAVDAAYRRANEHADGELAEVTDSWGALREGASAALEVLIEDPHVIERAGRAIAGLADENYDDPWVSRDQFDGDARKILRAAFGATEEPTT